MINTKKAFTLVELIVVITILAILGTIAFISLQGYSADARNSKRTQDLNNLAGAVNIKVTKGTPLLSFTNSLPASKVNSMSIAGAASTVSNYDAGTPNYTTLGVKASDFKDPNGSDYRVGVTTTQDGKFEFAATMENWAGTSTAKVTGSYKGRWYGTGTVTATGTNTVILDDASINKFFRNDVIKSVGNSQTGTITLISDDKKTLTTSIQFTGTGYIILNASEKAGLISKKGGSSITPVTNNWTDLPY